jgi:hypothetical protein
VGGWNDAGGPRRWQGEDGPASEECTRDSGARRLLYSVREQMVWRLIVPSSASFRLARAIEGRPPGITDRTRQRPSDHGQWCSGRWISVAWTHPPTHGHPAALSGRDLSGGMEPRDAPRYWEAAEGIGPQMRHRLLASQQECAQVRAERTDTRRGHSTRDRFGGIAIPAGVRGNVLDGGSLGRQRLRVSFVAAPTLDLKHFGRLTPRGPQPFLAAQCPITIGRDVAVRGERRHFAGARCTIADRSRCGPTSLCAPVAERYAEELPPSRARGSTVWRSQLMAYGGVL